MLKNKYPINGFATGSYSCKCFKCGQRFWGDKRAVRCEPCATQGIEYNGTEWVVSPSTAGKEEGETDQADLWKEVAKIFTGIIGNSQWIEAIDKAKSKYEIKLK